MWANNTHTNHINPHLAVVLLRIPLLKRVNGEKRELFETYRFGQRTRQSTEASDRYLNFGYWCQGMHCGIHVSIHTTMTGDDNMAILL